MRCVAGVVSLGLIGAGCVAEPAASLAQPDAAVQRPTGSAAAGSGAGGSGGSQNDPSGAAGDAPGSGGSSNGGGDVGSGAGGVGSGAADAAMPAIDADGGPIGGRETGSDAGQPAAGPFVCSKMVGLWVMSQWYGTFEKGVDNARWEYIFVHHGYLEMWADPASAYWKTAVISPCATGPEAPDRVIFLPFSLSLNTLDQWQSNIEKVVQAIRTLVPSVKRIELISTIRSPGNMPCPNDTDPNIVVPPYVDQAIQNVADGSGGLVTVGPKIAVENCNWWVGGTDLTGEGNTGVGRLYAEYYKDH
jgi:hypothetical protein